VDTLPADLLTPQAVYLKLSAGSGNSFLLESVEGGETLSRYSFIGADPDFTAEGNDRSVSVSSSNGKSEIPVPMIKFLRDHFCKYRVHQDETLPSFVGGAIGTFNFDCSSWFEPSLMNSGDGDDRSSMMFYRSVVAFDHAKQVIRIITLVFTDEAAGDDVELRVLLDNADRQNQRVRARLESSTIGLPSAGTDNNPAPACSNC
jgi:anthranilate synthase component 1